MDLKKNLFLFSNLFDAWLEKGNNRNNHLFNEISIYISALYILVIYTLIFSFQLFSVKLLFPFLFFLFNNPLFAVNNSV